MEYLKINNRAALNKLTIKELDELLIRFRVPRSLQVQRNLEPKPVKVNDLLRFYRRQFDAGALFVEVKEKKAKTAQPEKEEAGA